MKKFISFLTSVLILISSCSTSFATMSDHNDNTDVTLYDGTSPVPNKA